jgi:hypothetical protein
LTLDSCGCEITYDRKRVLVLNPGDRKHLTLPAIRLTAGIPVRMVMNVITPKEAKGSYVFDLVRISGKQVIGGVTYQIEMKDAW